MKIPAVWMFLGCTLFSGCTSTIHKPLTIDSTPANSISLDGKQRMVIVTDRGGSKNNARVVCAEPSPDALVGIAASASAGLSVSGKASAELATSLAEAVQTVGRRTQTIQLLRDGLYRACEAYLNGAITAQEYKLIISRVDDMAVTLVAIDGLTGGLNVPVSSIVTSANATRDRTKESGQGGNTAASTNPQGATQPEPAQPGAGPGTNATAGSNAPPLPTIQVSDQSSTAVKEIVTAFYLHQKTMADTDLALIQALPNVERDKIQLAKLRRELGLEPH